MPFSSQQLDLIKTVKRHLPAGMHACLVGGALRDMLLGMPLRDMDFILPGNTRQVARAVAKNLGALSFLLDAERNTMRVIHSRPEDGDFYLDFIQQTGETIQEDLKARDFTINAMALGLDDLDQLIDPLNGLMDLHAKVLKACSPGAMLADPLRCLRGLRLSNSLGFHLEKNTITQIRKALPQLDRSAPERIRDEIFRLFNESHPERALRALDVLGGMELLFPELMPFKKTEETDPNLPNSQEPRLATLASLQELLLILTQVPDQAGKGNWVMGMVSLHLGRYRDRFTEYLKQCITKARTKRALLFFSALFLDVDHPEAVVNGPIYHKHDYRHDPILAPSAVKRGLALVLSNDEIDWLDRIIKNQADIHKLSDTGLAMSPRTIYHFFQRSGDAGVAICVLSLADILATHGMTITREILEMELLTCRQLLEAWWERPEKLVRPPNLLNGDRLIQKLGIEAGPLVGELLEALRLAQVEGRVTTAAQGLDLARQLIRNGNTNPPEEI